MPPIPFEGPFWLVASLTIVGFIVIHAPKLLEVWDRTRAFNREYDRQKKTLELIKLRYEIDILKKDNQLEDQEHEFQLLEKRAEEAKRVDNQPKLLSRVHPSFAFVGGVLGFGSVPLLELAIQLLNQNVPATPSEPLSGISAAVTLVVSVVFGGVSGIVYAEWAFILAPLIRIKLRISKGSSFRIGFFCSFTVISLSQLFARVVG